MLESLFECEQPYVERVDTWQREKLRRNGRGVRHSERKQTAQRVLPESAQDTAR